MRFRLYAVMLCSVAAGAVLVSQAQTVLGQGSPAQKPLSPPATANVSLPGATITIDYSAPSVKGRTIFGGLVPYDKVWRTGANAATTLKTTGNLKIGDLTVPAGTYTLYSLPSANGWKLIVNKQTGQWGTVYNEGQDLGRTSMDVASAGAPAETMVIDFEKTSGNSTELHVKWASQDASVRVTAGK